jgi:hypothetical protein
VRELRIRYDLTDNDREDGRGTFQNLRHFLSDGMSVEEIIRESLRSLV